MLVLHAAFTDRAPLLWVEHPAEETEQADLTLKSLGRGGKRRKAYAWLPCADHTPLPSSPLLAAANAEPSAPAGAEAKAEVRLQRRGIPCIRLSWDSALELLCSCMGRRLFAPGVLIGNDLGYWTSALRFAGLLVHKKAYLPGLEDDGERCAAVWEPVIDGEDRQTLAGLAAAMPAAARALSVEAREQAPATPPSEVLKGFLNGALNALVRAAIHDGAGQSRPHVRKSAAGFDSLHDHWLHALRAGDGAIAADPPELAKLRAQIAEWRKPLALTMASPYRLCFRLEEPAEESGKGPWYVRYLVQPAADVSLVIPVPEAFRAQGRKVLASVAGGSAVQEAVLSSLGRASAFSPHIEQSLAASVPEGYSLEESGAYEFLSSTSILLERCGFGVFLPAWWTRKGAKVRLSIGARVKTPALRSNAGMTLDKVLKVRWEVALGNQALSLEELESLAALKAPLIKVRGQWVAMSAEEIQAALAFWQGKGDTRMKARELLALSLGNHDTVAGMDFRGVQAGGWIGELLERLRGDCRFAELPPPSGFCGTLRPYQVRGYSWLSFLSQWGLGACLADDMGLGKTVQTLALILARREGGERRPFLLVCPTSVVANWKKEAARFTPELPVVIHHGLERKKGESLRQEAEGQAMVISTYGLVHRDLEHLAAVPWAGVILDEAQNVKNPEAKQSRAVRSLSAPCRFALTGTPVENHVGDLWSVMEFLNPGLLGSRAEFKRRFFIPIQANRDAEAAASLRRLTGPFVLRRVKTDPTVIADLPRKMEMKVWCTITAEQASLYKAVADEAEEAMAGAEGITRRGVILATLTKLKQVLNHPVQFLKDNSQVPGRSGKLQRLTEMLEEVLESGERSLVFTQFTEMGEILRRHLQAAFGEEVPFLHGGVPRKQRDALVERFQNDEQAPHFFLLSLKAGGTGLNLTRANHVFHYDRWWNPAVENQATDRAFRIGQKKNVEVHAFLCSGTVEEHIDELIERKKEVAGTVVGAGEAWLTELSDTQIRHLFQLRADAQEE